MAGSIMKVRTAHLHSRLLLCLLANMGTEFRSFVEQTEKQLLLLFHSIDRDHNGKLDKAELREAFRKAGLSVPLRKLDAFFNDIDYNNDGYISFGEWRDFLLFMPVHDGEVPLKTVLDFYASIVTLTAEGDSMVSEDSLEGLGTTGFLLQTLFGSIFRIASPLDNDKNLAGPASSSPAPAHSHAPLEEERLAAESARSSGSVPSTSTQSAEATNQRDRDAMEMAILQAYATALDASRELERATIARSLSLDQNDTLAADPTMATTSSTMDKDRTERSLKSKLTSYVPDPGYFIAGAAAGGLSRTATAPLDRLKVYLLVNTRSSTDTAVSALKQGKPLVALRNAGKPFGDAVKDLWRAGGMRSLFAGELNYLLYADCASSF